MQNTGKKILLVDDDPDILQFLQVLFEEEGYEVSTFTRYQDLEQIHDGALPDLILLDVFLSGKDGREIVKDLKNQQETKDIPILLSSAHPRAQATARWTDADDFVTKPFDIDELLEKVAYYCTGQA